MSDPKPAAGETAMPFDAPAGTKVIWAKSSTGYPGDQHICRIWLKRGEIYTVLRTRIDRTSTSVWLREFPNVNFNHVVFALAPSPASSPQPSGRHTGPKHVPGAGAEWCLACDEAEKTASSPRKGVCDLNPALPHFKDQSECGPCVNWRAEKPEGRLDPTKCYCAEHYQPLGSGPCTKVEPEGERPGTCQFTKRPHTKGECFDNHSRSNTWQPIAPEADLDELCQKCGVKKQSLLHVDSATGKKHHEFAPEAAGGEKPELERLREMAQMLRQMAEEKPDMKLVDAAAVLLVASGPSS
jgi:hypothetical protein